MANGLHRVPMMLFVCSVGIVSLSCQREPSVGTITTGPGAAPQATPVPPPVRSSRVPVTTKSFLTLECQDTAVTDGPFLVSYSFEQGVAYLWKWDALQPKGTRVDLGVKPMYARLTSDMATLLYHEVNQGLALKRISPSEAIQSWTSGKEWYVSDLAGERGGRYVAVTLSEEVTVTNNFDNLKTRLGLFDAKTRDLTWVCTLEGKENAFGGLAVPDHEGSYIAVAKWQNQGAMVDTRAKKLLWTLSLPDSDFPDVEFSPDGKTLYVPGDSESLMYALDTVTGKVQGCWLADTSYGRFVSVTASPNGKWVAAGAGPAGDVCVWAVGTGKVVMHLKHANMATVYSVAFSPDSSLLATGGTHGNIQIWKMPN